MQMLKWPEAYQAHKACGLKQAKMPAKPLSIRYPSKYVCRPAVSVRMCCITSKAGN